MKINLSPFKKSKDSVPWLRAIAIEFCDEHELEFNVKARLWLRSRQGCEYFVKWLQARNWQASYWELPPLIDNNEEVYIGFGIEVKDDCPTFIEYKLKL